MVLIGAFAAMWAGISGVADAAAAACSADHAVFIPLGELPGGFVDSTAEAISDDGCVVVGESDSANGLEAFAWHDAIMTGLGDLDGGIFESHALGASADGSVIVGQATSSAGQRAVRWSGGGAVELLPPAEPMVQADTIATAVSDDGSVVVGSLDYGPWGCALRWVGEAAADLLGTCDGGFSVEPAIAWNVSALGDVVVGARGGQFPPRFGPTAFRSEAGEVTTLPGLATCEFASFGYAYDVSSDGRVAVGTSCSTGGAREAVRWEDGQAGALGYGTGTYAIGVSADGSVVVGGADTAALDDEAIIWDRRHGARSLKALLEQAGVDLTGWTLIDARDVSADGRSIVGSGRNPQGWSEAWLARLPEPAGVALDAAALAVLATRALGSARAARSPRR
jgi:probable HAF family extracellular repeat protein